jgi:hypothetical protein
MKKVNKEVAKKVSGGGVRTVKGNRTGTDL